MELQKGPRTFSRASELGRLSHQALVPPPPRYFQLKLFRTPNPSMPTQTPYPVTFDELSWVLKTGAGPQSASTLLPAAAAFVCAPPVLDLETSRSLLPVPRTLTVFAVPLSFRKDSNSPHALRAEDSPRDSRKLPLSLCAIKKKSF